MITISIVIYNNSIDEIKECLGHFVNSPLISEVIICDNHEKSTISPESVEALSEKLIYISNPENPGYGAGHNLAYQNRTKKTKYHTVMNLDVTAHNSIFKKLLDKAESDSSIVQIMPKVLNPDGTIQRLCKRLPKARDLFIRRFFPESRLKQKIITSYSLPEYRYDQDLNCPYLSGCFMFLRTSIFEKIGLFDEDFFMYPEDIDLTRRMHREGQTICFPQISIIHQHGKASYSSFRMTKIHILGMIKYFNKWGWIVDSERKEFNNNLKHRLRP